VPVVDPVRPSTPSVCYVLRLAPMCCQQTVPDPANNCWADKMRNRTVLTAIAVASACSVACVTTLRSGRTAAPRSLETLDERVTLKGGMTPTGWDRTVHDAKGRERLRVWLRPLIAVEGGTVAFEVGVSKPAGPDRNLLGERPLFSEACMCYPEVPSVVEIQHIEDGIENCRFGRVRRFNLPGAQERLVFEVLSVDLGRGVGSCEPCPRIEGITARIAIER
jgi:hypothetical protein